jgi:hypothetical protein
MVIFKKSIIPANSLVTPSPLFLSNSPRSFLPSPGRAVPPAFWRIGVQVKRDAPPESTNVSRMKRETSRVRKVFPKRNDSALPALSSNRFLFFGEGIHQFGCERLIVLSQYLEMTDIQEGNKDEMYLA